MKLIHQLNEPQPTLNAAFSALAMARLGKVTMDLSLTQASFRFYTTAIMELQKAVWDEKRMLNDETIASIMLMGLYEASDLVAEHYYTLNKHC